MPVFYSPPDLLLRVAAVGAGLGRDLLNLENRRELYKCALRRGGGKNLVDSTAAVKSAARVAVAVTFTGWPGGARELVLQAAELLAGRDRDRSGKWYAAALAQTEQGLTELANGERVDSRLVGEAMGAVKDVFAWHGLTVDELAALGFDPKRATDELLRRGAKQVHEAGDAGFLCMSAIAACYEVLLADSDRIPRREEAFQRQVLFQLASLNREQLALAEQQDRFGEWLHRRTAGVAARAREVRAAYLEQARTKISLAPGGQVLDREGEIELMANFTKQSGGGCLIWTADAWSGKSALLAWFVLHPPERVDVVAFFVDGWDSTASTGSHFLGGVTAQLEGYLDLPAEASDLSTPGATLGRYQDLLKRASCHAAAADRVLLLVVDGLDEDRTREATGAGQPASIATMLPHPDTGVLTIASTQPHEHVLDALRAVSANGNAAVRALSVSPNATSIKQAALKEIDDAITAMDLDRPVLQRILGLLTVAHSPLSLNDLTSLVNDGRVDPSPLGAIAVLARTRLRHTIRELQTSGQVSDVPVFGWAHDDLPTVIREQLGSELLDRYRDAIHKWTEDRIGHGWGPATPDYLEVGYATMLAATGDTARLVQLALDPDRHQWLRRRRGGNDQALEEIEQAIVLCIDGQPRDVGNLIRLAFDRDRLEGQFFHVPVELPALWAAVGDVRRAIAVTRSMSIASQPFAFAAIAQTLATAGDTAYAKILATEAERGAAFIADYNRHGKVLVAIAQARATSGDPAGAEGVFDTLTEYDGYYKAQASSAVAQALLKAGNADGVAEWVVAWAERGAAMINDPGFRAGALVAIAQALASAGNARAAERLAALAERAAAVVVNTGRAGALVAVAQALASAGNARGAERVLAKAERSERVADREWLRRLESGDQLLGRRQCSAERRAPALAATAHASAVAGHTADAERLAGRAERVANCIASPLERGKVLAAVAHALALAGKTAKAERVADKAERNAVTSQGPRSEVLAAVVRALACAGRTEKAERVAVAIANAHVRVLTLAAIAEALATADKHTDAVRLAVRAEKESREDGVQQPEALAAIARALIAAGENADAVRVVDGCPEAVLISVAQALAAAGDMNAAARLAAEAERASFGYAPHHKRAEALLAIARALAAVGKTAETERIAATVGNLYRTDVLTAVAQEFAAVGNFAEVARVLATIGDPRSLVYDQAVVKVVEVLAAGGYAADADRLAHTLHSEDTLTRVQALTAVVRAHGVAHDAAAAERVAAEIDSYYPVQATWQFLIPIAKALVAAGNFAAAERTAVKAERAARDIPHMHHYRRAYTLASIAQILASAGEPAEAERLMAKAKAERVSYIQEASGAEVSADVGIAGRAEIFAGIAQALAEAGQMAEAKRAAATSEWFADRATSDPDVYVYIAEALATAGCTAEAQRVAEKAEGAIDLYTDVDLQSSVMSTIVEVMAAAGDMANAVRLAGNIEDTWFRASALTSITRAYGLSAAAEPVAVMAESVVNQIKDEGARIRALVALAKARAVDVSARVAVERLACKAFLLDEWQLTIPLLYHIRGSAPESRPKDEWLTRELISDLIERKW